MTLLQNGDKAALISPSGDIADKSLDRSIEWFAGQGIETVIMPHAYEKHYYMAGENKVRTADLNACFARSDIKAVFCTRGGAGSLKILDLIDYNTVHENPKPVFGLSDSTALQNALYSQTGLVSYTGFLPVYDFKYGVLDAYVEACMKSIFAGKSYDVTGGKTLCKGHTDGVLIGGCLSVLCQLCGTKYFPDLKDKILILEDIGEKTYRLDLMFNQLRLQKNFDQLKGIVFGKFVNCLEADEGDGTVEDLIFDFARCINVPMLYDFPYGHQMSRCVLPIGGHVCLDADHCCLKVY